MLGLCLDFELGELFPINWSDRIRTCNLAVNSRLHYRCATDQGVADGSRTHDMRDHNPLFYHLNYSHNGRCGIRTHGRIAPTQHFQCCSFNRSDNLPVNGQRGIRTPDGILHGGLVNRCIKPLCHLSKA